MVDSEGAASGSPIDTPLWDSLQRIAARLVPGARCVPFLLPGTTDARFFRRLGTTAYGFGLFSDRISFASTGPWFTGTTSASTRSPGLQTKLWLGLAKDFLG